MPKWTPFVIPFGFEPKTYCLEGSCSIQLSYGTKTSILSAIVGSCFRRGGLSYRTKKKGDDCSSPTSGRQDSNLRPPGPKPGAMTGLRYAPNSYYQYVNFMLGSLFVVSASPL